MAEPTETFDPANLRKHLRPMKGGSEYMDVKWRLVWLREQHPDATIDTVELSHIPDKSATFKASVSVPGGGSASGHGSETASDFRDYYEKAETKALGRALAALGFGTQFLPDDHDALADAPVTHPQPRSATEPPRPDVRPNETVNRDTGEITANRGPAASEKQLNWILGLGKGRGFVDIGDDGLEHAHEEQVTAAINREFGTAYQTVRHISKADASRVIDKWAPPKDDRQQTPTPIRQNAPEEGDDLAWTEFWKWARLNGVNGAPGFLDLTQRKIEEFPTALEARAFLADRLASMPKTSTAGADRYTQ